jgi:hypothetical protein
MPKKKLTAPRGRPAETLEIPGRWETAVKRSFQKKRPAQGWPKAGKPA